MSMRSMRKHGVPEATAQLAQVVFPKGNIYMAMHDELEGFYEDDQFADLFGVRGHPAEAPWRMALLTVIQFVEDLSDSQAVEAVRSRIDVKYALELELEDTGFDASVLCKFRQCLVAGSAEQRLLDTMLERFKAQKLLKGRGKQRSDSTHVVAAIRNLTRIECVGETLRHTLNTLAAVVPDWLRERVSPAWFDRYGIRIELTRLPTIKAEREALILQMGTDGYQLMEWVYAVEGASLGYGRFRRWKSYVKCGCNNSIWTGVKCDGARKSNCHLARSKSCRPMMWTRALVRNAPPNGSATKPT